MLCYGHGVASVWLVVSASQSLALDEEVQEASLAQTLGSQVPRVPALNKPLSAEPAWPTPPQMFALRCQERSKASSDFHDDGLLVSLFA